MKFEGVLVDLLKLSTVKALAEQLLRRGQHIDAIVWNAGIAGWTGLNWPKAIWTVSTDLVHSTTYPLYMNCDVGLLTKSQTGKSEPKLGQVFTANVFGHYLLTHWISPLMNGESRIVCLSSVSAVPDTFSPEDIQGLKSSSAYESSKRLTDLLVLTSDLPSAKPYVQSFLPASTSTTESRPKMVVVHPGVVGTSIAGLHWFIELFMFASFYVARWLGSPWHPVTPYKGAVSAAFAVLSTQLPNSEAQEGKGKWGSSAGVSGDERVARTLVEGWGYCGRVGVVPTGSVTTGRYRGSKPLTAEIREGFEAQGRQAWKEMEEMRKEWEAILGPVDQTVSTDM